MSGHIRRRGTRSWELKFDVGADPLTGKRMTKYHSFKGTKREAEAELVRLKANADRGDYVEVSKTTLGQFIDRWEILAETQVSAKTLERYRELALHHVRPHLGAAQLQKLRTVDFAELYGRLQRPKPGGAGLSPRTVGHVHRLLRRQYSDAVRWGLVAVNPVAMAEPPRVQQTEITILSAEQIRAVLEALRGRVLYPIIVVALATGMRRGELVALRWRDVDLEGGQIRVERSLEQTNAGLAFKPPKTKAGRRSVTIPPAIVAELRSHWRLQQEHRLALGIGRATPDDLVFARTDASPWPPDSLTTAWQKTVAALKIPQVTLHGLRHTHVSQLIAAGIDVVSVSRRIGHCNPTVTLNVYAHLFGNPDQRAAAAVQTAMAAILSAGS
jgi:integrase